MHAEAKDSRRKWMWGLLALILISQFYVIQEMLAVFVLFTLCFVMLALVVMSLYMFQNCWELVVARLTDIRQPVMNMVSVSRENQGPT